MAPVLVGAAPAAHAIGLDQVCALSEVVTYSPPLTTTPQTVTFTVSGQLFDCTSSSAPTGYYAESGTAPNATCTSVLSAGSGTRVFHWNNSAIAPSTFSYNRVVSRVNGNIVVVALGAITSGTFTSDPAKSTGTGLEPDLTACGSTGVSQLTDVGTVTIGI
ncbi:hypothetical protein [Actinoallomurus soli]|uniref:hypothetical protein n=1 Tax=Actinoallomurus soli TaxID=2952535 RepID=UPI002093BED2|nr:hypothetical protein [Actinoallomurus soli]MCO5967495.1 hypothetical protein [Actinoallomurus soli]